MWSWLNSMRYVHPPRLPIGSHVAQEEHLLTDAP